MDNIFDNTLVDDLANSIKENCTPTTPQIPVVLGKYEPPKIVLRVPGNIIEANQQLGFLIRLVIDGTMHELKYEHCDFEDNFAIFYGSRLVPVNA